MKKNIYFGLFVFLFASFSSGQVIALDESIRVIQNDESHIERVYVSPNDIVIQPDLILVLKDGDYIPVTGIHVDEYGHYYEVIGRAPMGTWECPSCRYLNGWYRTTCWNCNWPEK